MPALFMRGSASGFPRSAVEDTACRFRAGRYVEIDGAGHFLWVERPAETLAAIGAFVEECDGAAVLPAPSTAGA
jgi:pimeloyl-ACP methyl ester carboxylesterase